MILLQVARSYYSHPNSKEEDKPKIIHQSSATGMQAIPTTGIAQGIQYSKELIQPTVTKSRKRMNYQLLFVHWVMQV